MCGSVKVDRPTISINNAYIWDKGQQILWVAIWGEVRDAHPTVDFFDGVADQNHLGTRGGAKLG